MPLPKREAALPSAWPTDGTVSLAPTVDEAGEREMPATDYLMPGGLDWDELADLMAPLGASPSLAGISLACVNPEKDPTGEYLERTVALLERACR